MTWNRPSRTPDLFSETTATAERRQSPRLLCEGPVRLSLECSMTAPTVGELMDISEEGFRASHEGLTLRSGDYVTFETAERTGIARVVWTRASGKQRESGFRVVEPGR